MTIASSDYTGFDGCVPIMLPVDRRPVFSGKSILSLDLMPSGAARRELYPPIEPYADGWLDVGDGHTLYWSECGNPDGVPVIFLHGGPGAGCMSAYRRFFNPRVWRVILLDQRGSGQSQPHACIEANTTQHLVADLELLRCTRGVERWLMFGGSWGSTLGLAYGQAHPEACLGFILRGVFGGTQAEIDWFMTGMAYFFPEAGEDFRSLIPSHEQGDLLVAYFDRLIHPQPEVHLPAAHAWASYESGCASLRARGRDMRLGSNRFALAVARMEAHYFRHACFLAPDQLFRDLSRVAHLPCHVVQGRYDVICPPATAQRLVTGWPGATLEMIEDAGHSALEPGIRAALVRAADRFGQTLLPEV
jgi:proline iminopeptidase